MPADSVSNNVPDYLSLLRLDGRGFVVLGAGQGIGAQTVHALTQAGARVLCVDQDKKLARDIADQAGGIACTADATSRSDMERVFGHARHEFGRVHGIVDIIGVAGIKPLAAVDDASWARQFDIVVRHAYLAIQIGGEAMKKEGGGTWHLSVRWPAIGPCQTRWPTLRQRRPCIILCGAQEPNMLPTTCVSTPWPLALSAHLA
jgi:NAD(P)-dependent dehydrogenase (short-subunit alcohol dehydrogenase family)